MMNILFIHQNFPGQFKHLAPALVARGHTVFALTMQKLPPSDWNGVKIIPYMVQRGSSKTIHPWVSDFETKTIRGEACFLAALNLRKEGFIPDLIIAHPGWGESLFIKDVWPTAKIAIYCEFFYHFHGADFGFDPEFPPLDEGEACRLRLKNINNLLHFEIADAAISPTKWQASTFPERFRSRITIIHDGIDTDVIRPNPNVRLILNKSLQITQEDEIVTFVNRNLEPYRGYHIFMRALPNILKERPKARVLIVGGDDVSYGARSATGKKWKDIFFNEIRSQITEIEMQRVHFLGNISYEHFIPLLQISSAHVYLTYPFVLSWSLIEAMSAGCAIIASDTAPVCEAIADGKTGLLTSFFDVQALTEKITSVLRERDLAISLGKNAREFARENFDLRTICLPRQIKWAEELA